MNYFEFYGLDEAFVIDVKELKKQYFRNSREYHPDFYTLADEESKDAALAKSSINNQAYETLSNFDKRLKYILDINGIIDEQLKNQIPQEFLFEMMEINEALMELEFNYDENTLSDIRKNIDNQIDNLTYKLMLEVTTYSKMSPQKEDILEKAKDYYLKKRYLLRILENLNNFAPH